MKLSTLASLAKEVDADMIHNVSRLLFRRLPFERRHSAASRIASATGFMLAGAAIGAVALVVTNAINPTLLRVATQKLRLAKYSAEDALSSATHAVCERADLMLKEGSTNSERASA